jgi:hypothetical protein
MGDWEPYVKLGAFRAETVGTTQYITNFYSAPGRILTRTVVGDDSKFESTTEAMIAIGIGYTLAGHYGIALEATRIPKLGSETVTGEGDLTSLSLALQYRF